MQLSQTGNGGGVVAVEDLDLGVVEDRANEALKRLKTKDRQFQELLWRSVALSVTHYSEDWFWAAVDDTKNNARKNSRRYFKVALTTSSRLEESALDLLLRQMSRPPCIGTATVKAA